MIARAFRLRTAEVQEVLAHGKAARGAYVSFKAVRQEGPLRVAAIVSKKLAKTAPRRNRIRRAVYDAIRTSTLPRNILAACIVHTLPPSPLTTSIRRDIETICSKHFS